ncbi:protein phosphatase 2C 29 [Ziziphus jujuba]|uniref:Protein phosphatase 2C 29 n=1 Tax=Ziziphus jujuba TaxID=326968 RepID=A0A6P3ZK03_ZIZJJ|nr:protein phosphatase 2C 29 [Ziziphus jujuba]
MGGGLSSVFPCFTAVNRNNNNSNNNQSEHHLQHHNQLQQHQQDLIFAASEPLDETLGHSFCYVPSSARFVSPTQSDRFLSPSHSLRFSPSHEPVGVPRTRSGPPETVFKTISGASVSANTSTPRTVLQLENIYDDATDSTLGGGVGCGVRGSIVNGFESTSSFSALPLQPVPRGGGEPSGPMERGGFFLSGPIERGALSGPLDANAAGHDGGGGGGGVHFSAPLGGLYVKKKRKKGISGIRKAFYRNFSEKKRPWVVPVLNFVGRKEGSAAGDESEVKSESNVQWALGKAGEDRVHVVVSEEQGWLFVGIYDGFNGPDAPEFLMGNLYRAVYNELQGLFWEVDEANDDHPRPPPPPPPFVEAVAESAVIVEKETNHPLEIKEDSQILPPADDDRAGNGAKRVTFQSEGQTTTTTTTESEKTETETGNNRRRRLWEFLAEAEAEDGLDLSGSERFAFSVDDALSVSNGGSAVSRRWLLLSKLKQGLSKHKESAGHGRKFFPWRFGLEDKEKVEVDNRAEETSAQTGRKRKEGPVDHELVLSALSRALEVTELAYLEMTDKVLDTNPELALMGSCLLVVLMRDEDVYVMNVGDSRAIVAHYEPEEVGSSVESRGRRDNGSGGGVEGIIEEASAEGERAIKVENEASEQTMRLTALQLSTDHSTSIEEEIIRIKNEHPDDNHCIVNDRVKGRLKVTRAFGAGFLKQPKWNDALLEMFRNEYIGTAPYISCLPSLRHHKLYPRDQFLVLSSDGLYQYLTNEEVVSQVENFLEKSPDGDPAQHLIEELLFRAAKKAGMDFHELLDIPQGDRRKYHDDVTVMVISLEGRIWKSSGKYL